MRAVIFDIDGTLADCAHRRAHLVGEKKNWAAFNDTMHLDPVIEPVMEVLRTLQSAGSAIVLCSGREAVFRDVTETWLRKHGVPYKALYMRGVKDYRADPEIKSELLDEIRKDGFDPWLVVDDRQRVVDMWRARGLTCLQCAPGDF